MNFDKFIDEILLNLKTNNEDCINKIEKNESLIKKYFIGNKNNTNVNEFLKKINNIILQKEKNFSIIEKILKHDFFTQVYHEFKNSEILIDVCKNENINSIKWLLTMNINSCIQNEEGLSALMYASKNPSLCFVVEYFSSDNSCLNLVDNNNENALFYALRNKDALNILIKTNINVNQVNKNGDTPLLYCCKNDIFDSINILLNRMDIDVNIADNEEKTAAMYLGTKARKIEFVSLNRRNCDYNFKNSKNESVISSIINSMYSPVEVYGYFNIYIRILITLIHFGCNFNIPVDEAGNTPVMVYIIVRDCYMLLYTLKYCGNIDLSMKNKYGENASSLFIKYINCKSIYNIMNNHKTFDFNYIDTRNNNNMLMICSITEPKLISKILENSPNKINEVNNRKENALIIAVKFGCKKSVEKLLKYNINVNQQDDQGNTALYYAIKIQNISIIKILLHSNADMNLKNNNGISALNYANELNNKDILNVLHSLYSSSSRSSSSSSLSSINKSKEKLVKIVSNISRNKKDINPMKETNSVDKINSNINYKEMLEYLYPNVGNHYSEFKMTKNKISLEKKIFTEFFSNMELKYALELYNPITGFNYLKCLKIITGFGFDVAF